MRILLAALLVLSGISIATEFTQDDWSGSDGVEGPVTSWENTFFVSYNIFFANETLTLGTGTFLQNPVNHLFVDSLYNSNSLACGDIDSDGDIDVVGTGQEPGQVVWYDNETGSAESWTSNIIASPEGVLSQLIVADIDSDGDMDVIGTLYYNPDQAYFWENLNGSGTSWAEHTGFDEIADCFFSMGDVDADGDLDLIATSGDEDEGAWFENDVASEESWIAHVFVEDINWLRSAHLSDIDGDGDMDILTSYRQSELWFFSWFENVDGSGFTWIEHVLSESVDEISSVYGVDLDDDGDTDLVGSWFDHWEDEMNGKIVCFENLDGFGASWAEHTVSDSGILSIGVSDLDEDGDLDIYGSRVLDNIPYEAFDVVLFCENESGLCDSWVIHSLYELNWGPIWSEIIATDINSDGKLEFVHATHSHISWWDFIGFASEGYLESSILDTKENDPWDASAFGGTCIPGVTMLNAQYRSSDDPSDMGEWSDITPLSDNSSANTQYESTQYLQYKVILETSDPLLTPEFQNISFYYSMGIEGNDPGQELSCYLVISENPTYGSINAIVSLSENQMVDFLLYDVSGRVIAQNSQELPTGTHSIGFTGLAQGVYFCAMSAGDFVAREKIVVLE